MRQIGSGTTLIERADWGARPSRGTTWITPTEGVTGHWEGNGIGWPWAHPTCFSLVRGIQAFHMDGHGWSDIAYNGLACPHGYVFEGRGPNIRSAGHGEPGNSLSYALCFLSGVADEFTPEQHRAWADGRLWLIQEGGATDVLHCHRDWMNTQCPGDDRCQWIKSGALAPTTTGDDMDLTEANLQAIGRAVLSAEVHSKVDGHPLSFGELAEWTHAEAFAGRTRDLSTLADQIAVEVIAASGGNLDAAVVKQAVEDGLKKVLTEGTGG